MITTLLLTKNDQYLIEGRLPKRPDFDKDLLAGLAKGLTVSKKGYDMLPNSIKKEVHCPIGISKEPNFPITIPEISGLADILLVVRSLEIGGSDSKVFRFDNFELLLKQRDIEIYMRKKTK